MTLIAGCATPIFCASICAKIRAAHSNMSDKVVNVPLFFSVRDGGANKVRGYAEVKRMNLGPVKSWQDYVMTIMPFVARSSAGMHRFGMKYPPYLFRGQTHASYKLVASIFRDPGKKGVVKVVDSFFKKERMIIGMVRNQLADYLNCSEWDLVAAAQHHGVFTRYLDWTSDPFVSLAFAFKHEMDVDVKDLPAVWVLKTNVDDFAIPEKDDSPIPNCVGAKTKIYLPKKVVGQVVAQDSYLMRQVIEKDGDSHKVVPLEENVMFEKRLWKIEFNNEAVGDIVWGLKALGICAKSLVSPENWEGLEVDCKDILHKKL